MDHRHVAGRGEGGGVALVERPAELVCPYQRCTVLLECDLVVLGGVSAEDLAIEQEPIHDRVGGRSDPAPSRRPQREVLAAVDRDRVFFDDRRCDITRRVNDPAAPGSADAVCINGCTGCRESSSIQGDLEPEVGSQLRR
ncbi:hypothetical protein D3C76_1443090 [compost metagenome]